ncbi:hypothetical protein [Corynebacterium amycolatum]|uniref:hypothetical protein n=1 Tax=Corynebacterium amycolatum TaxID=43765 RepID=UPI0031840D86
MSFSMTSPSPLTQPEPAVATTSARQALLDPVQQKQYAAKPSQAKAVILAVFLCLLFVDQFVYILFQQA